MVNIKQMRYIRENMCNLALKNVDILKVLQISTGSIIKGMVNGTIQIITIDMYIDLEKKRS